MAQQRYADPSGGYSITPLGAPAGPSVEQQLYGGAGHPPDPQQLANFFGAAVGGYPATPAALMGPQMGADIDSEQLNQQKLLIREHPLYPLLHVLFQKCELATCTPREPAREGDQDQVDLKGVYSAASFNEDLDDFVETAHRNGTHRHYVPNPELDTLMINAIQVLRYHLLELEKVHELCDNFCAKYVNKIKERTQMDIIAGEQPPPPPPLDQQQGTSRSQQQQPMKADPSPGSSSTASMDHHQLQQQHFGTPQQQQYASGPDHQLENAHQPPCSSDPHQQQQNLGFLDHNTAAAAAATSAAMQAGLNVDQLQQQFYMQAQQQMGMGQQQPEMPAVVGCAKSAKRAKKSHQQSNGHQQTATITGGMNNQPRETANPSPDTTGRTDSAGGSRSSTAAATGEDGSTVPPPVNGVSMMGTPQKAVVQHQNSLDSLDEAGGDDGFSNDSMGEERDSGASESEQKPHHLRNGTNGDGSVSQKRKVPKVFSKEAISKFRAWLFNNITHPYPSEEQKKQLAAETGLTILQVNNWFINARRRIVQPMIDSNNRAGRPVSVFKNRRRKSSGGGGTSPSPAPADGKSPELLTNGDGGGSPDESSGTGANTSGASSGGSSSVTGGGHLQAPAPPSLLAFSSPSANPYQTAAAAAVAAAVTNHPYAAAGFGGAFPFAAAGMGAMMPAYGLNGGGWPTTMDHLGHRGGLDG